jgi:chemotaxis protein histidine kinase CheA/ActR/RegA family two-component response regulator
MNPAEAFPNPADLAEAQLQEELRGMFAVDTQQYLESYFSITSSLCEAEWVAQIQELYRCIHTIKGGAVTVGAEAVLQVAIILEDLLSDLRCLKTAPELDDGQLSEILQEAGDLLTASVQIEAVDVAAVIAPTLERLQVLHQLVKQRYLPEWNENQQLFQEFAEQGFDLVVLDLEIALEGLPKAKHISRPMVRAAQSTLEQLGQIGKDLEMAEGWQKLIRQGQALLEQEDIQLWRQFWPAYLPLLKDNARQGGADGEIVAAFIEAFPCEPPQPTRNKGKGPLDASQYITSTDDAPSPLFDLDNALGFDFADSGLLESLVPESPSGDAPEETPVDSFLGGLPEPDMAISEFTDFSEFADFLDIPGFEATPAAESQPALAFNDDLGLSEAEPLTGDFLDSFLDPDLLAALPADLSELPESESETFEPVEFAPPTSFFEPDFGVEVMGFETPEIETFESETFELETVDSEEVIAALNAPAEALELDFTELGFEDYLLTDPIPDVELVELTAAEPMTSGLETLEFLPPGLLAPGLVDLDVTIPETVDLDQNLVPIDVDAPELRADSESIDYLAPADYSLDVTTSEFILEPIPTAEMPSETAVESTESEFDWSIEAPLEPEVLPELAGLQPLETTPEAGSEASSEADFEWVIDEPMAPAASQTSTTPTPALNLGAKVPDLATPKLVQIPVPLERLDRSAQHLIETLMSARTTQGMAKKLQTQLHRIHNLSQESIEFVAELRQLQDSYTLMNDHQESASNDGSGLALERYRQGYLMINRLLEANLRLFELGAEAASSAQSATSGLQVLERNLLNLQQTIEESRLVLFKSLAVRARAIVRDLTTRVGKPAQLRIYGEQLELDANTAQSLEPVLLHLLRNAYDHGLETPEQRLQAGKPAQGTLTLSLQRRGSSYLLELKDDGGGVNPAKISQIAQSKGLALTDTSTSTKLLAVICQPGFSSQAQVSDISGRGVGMDVVVSQITALGGKLSLDTKLGQGTTFLIQLPVPQLLVRCVLVRAGNITFALPADDIATTTMTYGLDVQSVPRQVTGCAWQIPEGDKMVPGLHLGDYWSAQLTHHPLTDTAIALRIESQTMLGADGTPSPAWLLADDLLEQADLLITPLPEPMVGPIGVIGVSLQADGKFIPVLDAVTLAEYLAQPETAAADALAIAQEVAAHHPAIPVAAKQTFTGESTILVVDDAALVRRRIEASLSGAGYVVHTCVDGLDAWNWLQNHTIPSLVITDIEMPNMDGFTLINNCRQAGMDMPMLVVSSRVSDDWGREARRLGATDYLTKGFTTPQLLEKVESVIQTSERARTLV